MQFEKAICPYCGAGLKIHPGQNEIKCDYCAGTILISGVDIHPITDDNNIRSAKNSGEIKETHNHEKTVRKTYSFFPPPGFRNRNFVHIIAAVIGYLFILLVAMNLDTFLDAVFFMIAMLSVIDICLDWTGLYSRLPGMLSEHQILRIIMKALWSIAFFVTWTVLLVILQEFFLI